MPGRAQNFPGGAAGEPNPVAVSRELWQPNNNDAYSAARRGANRLTLRTNWGQIAPVDRDLRIFRAGASAFLGMDCMRCSSRLSRARKIGTGRALARLVAIAFVLVGIMSAAQAQSPTPTPTPTPTPSPTPSPTPTVINSTVSSGAAVTNLGSNFLERLGNQSSNGFNRLQRTNPGRRRRLREHGSAALPDLVRRLRQLHEERRDRRFRRRYQKDLGRRGRDRRAGGAGHQYRLLGRPEPLGDRYSAGAAIGDDRPDPDRFHGLRRQRAVDLGQRGGARFRQHQFAPRHRAWDLRPPDTMRGSTAS